MHFCIPITLSLLSLGASDLWIESSLTPVLEAAKGESASSLDGGKVYAARGESESFQVWVQAGRKGLENLRIEGEAVSELIGPPRIHQIAALELGSGATPHVADPLLPPSPVTLERDQGAGYWVSYDIPPEAEPGIYQSALQIHADNARSRKVDVRVEVFGFTLPDVPSLPAYFHLDRGDIERAYALPKRDLEAWQPIYDSLRGYRIAFSLWEGGGLVPVSPDGRANTEHFKAHLEYVNRDAPMAAIELAGQGRGLANFPPPKPGDPQDPLQLYLFDMMQWLGERGWQDRALVEPILIPPRMAWQQARDALFRCRLADDRIPRVLAAPPHPFFERYTERYAVPYSDYDPLLIQRLKKGLSLEQAPPKAARPSASEAAGLSAASDAYDGSLYTSWKSAGEPKGSHTVWFDLEFETPLTLDQFTIVWETGYETTNINVLTAFPGSPVGTTSVDWEHDIGMGAFLQNRSTATLKFQKEVRLLRLEFTSASGKGPIGVTEVLIGAGEYDALEEIPPIAPWLDLTQDAFPNLAATGLPMTARIIPWVCWNAGMSGIYGGALNDWPISWSRASAAYRVDDAEASQNVLYYPGADSLLPGIRLMRLRDGLEDYEYLVAMTDAAQQTAPDDPALTALLRRQPFGLNPRAEELAELAGRIEDARIRIGRWLTEVQAE